MKSFTMDLRSITQFIIIGIMWGVIPVIAQSCNYPSWQEYWKDGNPHLLFLAGFSSSFLMSLYKHHIDYKKPKVES